MGSPATVEKLSFQFKTKTELSRRHLLQNDSVLVGPHAAQWLTSRNLNFNQTHLSKKDSHMCRRRALHIAGSLRALITPLGTRRCAEKLWKPLIPRIKKILISLLASQRSSFYGVKRSYAEIRTNNPTGGCDTVVFQFHKHICHFNFLEIILKIVQNN